MILISKNRIQKHLVVIDAKKIQLQNPKKTNSINQTGYEIGRLKLAKLSVCLTKPVTTFKPVRLTSKLLLVKIVTNLHDTVG